VNAPLDDLPVTLSEIESAAELLTGVIERTPVAHSRALSLKLGSEVFFKCENLQRSGSFKARGAYVRMAKLSEAEKVHGVVAASAGNHAQGVALAAQKLGIKAVIVMPKHTPLIKVEATKRYGADVILTGEVYDEAYEYAKKLQEKEGYTFVHPFDDEDVIEGQGTIALEVLDELPDADIILVPIGGGGLISGIASAAKLKNPLIKIIGVEPEGAASALEARKNKHVVELAEANTIADGTAVKKIGEITFDYIEKYVDDIVTVSDYELMAAFLILVEKHKIVAENSGILSVAGLKKLNVKGKKIISIISGGNIDVLTISSMINKGLIARGRIFTFAVDLPDKPGQLVAVSQILSKQNANVIRLEHNQFKNLDRFHEVELQVTVETNGEEHINKITEEFKKSGYRIKRLNSQAIIDD